MKFYKHRLHKVHKNLLKGEGREREIEYFVFLRAGLLRLVQEQNYFKSQKNVYSFLPHLKDHQHLN